MHSGTVLSVGHLCSGCTQSHIYCSYVRKTEENGLFNNLTYYNLLLRCFTGSEKLNALTTESFDQHQQVQNFFVEVRISYLKHFILFISYQ